MDVKWQAVMLVSPRRIECDECGALAIFIVLEDADEKGDAKDKIFQPWCQECFRKAQESEG